MIAPVFVALAVVGALGRWAVSRINRPDWPGGTLAVNLGAAFLLGLLHGAGAGTRTLVGVALLGSYSTFSTVMLELVDLRTHGGSRVAAWYLTATVVGGVGLAFAGLRLG